MTTDVALDRAGLLGRVRALSYQASRLVLYSPSRIAVDIDVDALVIKRIDLDAPTLREDPARLSDEAAAFSMFGDKRWIRVNGIGDDCLPALNALLDAEAAGNPGVNSGSGHSQSVA